MRKRRGRKPGPRVKASNLPAGSSSEDATAASAEEEKSEGVDPAAAVAGLDASVEQQQQDGGDRQPTLNSRQVPDNSGELPGSSGQLQGTSGHLPGNGGQAVVSSVSGHRPQSQSDEFNVDADEMSRDLMDCEMIGDLAVDINMSDFITVDEVMNMIGDMNPGSGGARVDSEPQRQLHTPTMEIEQQGGEEKMDVKGQSAEQVELKKNVQDEEVNTEVPIELQQALDESIGKISKTENEKQNTQTEDNKSGTEVASLAQDNEDDKNERFSDAPMGSENEPRFQGNIETAAIEAINENIAQIDGSANLTSLTQNDSEDLTLSSSNQGPKTEETEKGTINECDSLGQPSMALNDSCEQNPVQKENVESVLDQEKVVSMEIEEDIDSKRIDSSTVSGNDSSSFSKNEVLGENPVVLHEHNTAGENKFTTNIESISSEEMISSKFTDSGNTTPLTEKTKPAESEAQLEKPVDTQTPLIFDTKAPSSGMFSAAQDNSQTHNFEADSKVTAVESVPPFTSHREPQKVMTPDNVPPASDGVEDTQCTAMLGEVEHKTTASEPSQDDKDVCLSVSATDDATQQILESKTHTEIVSPIDGASSNEKPNPSLAAEISVKMVSDVPIPPASKETDAASFPSPPSDVYSDQGTVGFQGSKQEMEESEQYGPITPQEYERELALTTKQSSVKESSNKGPVRFPESSKQKAEESEQYGPITPQEHERQLALTTKQSSVKENSNKGPVGFPESSKQKAEESEQYGPITPQEYERQLALKRKNVAQEISEELAPKKTKLTQYMFGVKRKSTEGQATGEEKQVIRETEDSKPPSSSSTSNSVTSSSNSTNVTSSNSSSSKAGYTLMVGNIPAGTKAAEVKLLFEAYGKVLNAKILGNSKNPKAPVFSQIMMENEEETDLAVKSLHKCVFKGNKIVVKKKSKPEDQSQEKKDSPAVKKETPTPETPKQAPLEQQTVAPSIDPVQAALAAAKASIETKLLSAEDKAVKKKGGNEYTDDIYLSFEVSDTYQGKPTLKTTAVTSTTTTATTTQSQAKAAKTSIDLSTKKRMQSYMASMLAAKKSGQKVPKLASKQEVSDLKTRLIEKSKLKKQGVTQSVEEEEKVDEKAARAAKIEAALAAQASLLAEIARSKIQVASTASAVPQVPVSTPVTASDVSTPAAAVAPVPFSVPLPQSQPTDSVIPTTSVPVSTLSSSSVTTTVTEAQPPSMSVASTTGTLYSAPTPVVPTTLSPVSSFAPSAVSVATSSNVVTTAATTGPTVSTAVTQIGQSSSLQGVSLPPSAPPPGVPPAPVVPPAPGVSSARMAVMEMLTVNKKLPTSSDGGAQAAPLMFPNPPAPGSSSSDPALSSWGQGAAQWGPPGSSGPGWGHPPPPNYGYPPQGQGNNWNNQSYQGWSQGGTPTSSSGWNQHHSGWGPYPPPPRGYPPGPHGGLWPQAQMGPPGPWGPGYPGGWSATPTMGGRVPTPGQDVAESKTTEEPEPEAGSAGDDNTKVSDQTEDVDLPINKELQAAMEEDDEDDGKTEMWQSLARAWAKGKMDYNNYCNDYYNSYYGAPQYGNNYGGGSGHMGYPPGPPPPGGPRYPPPHMQQGYNQQGYPTYPYQQTGPNMSSGPPAGVPPPAPDSGSNAGQLGQGDGQEVTHGTEQSASGPDPSNESQDVKTPTDGEKTKTNLNSSAKKENGLLGDLTTSFTTVSESLELKSSGLMSINAAPPVAPPTVNSAPPVAPPEGVLQDTPTENSENVSMEVDMDTSP
ncbi:mucin-17 [Lingula anatina]|uniref:Mucin-17 n=1 Tax=Lingula anatina TaxID=7574 RepID=A0A1S3JAW1_LINAN|nr:mucin-17 [Lingula anatina]|eukprot:XP_013407463.1 mucin-17 [Lingula anatina]